MINLEKGQRVDLTKNNPTLNEIKVALGWDASRGGTDFDLDVFVLAVDNNKSLIDTCYFGKKQIFNDTIVHSGDNLTGVGDGDDETILIKLKDLPSNVDKLLFSVNIYQAKSKNQNFGQVRNAFIRVVDNSKNEEILRYDLSEDYSVFEGVTFGEIYRHNGEWKFGAITTGYNGTINDAIAML